LILLRNVWFITLEKLTDFADPLISFDCFSRSFFTSSSSRTMVIRFPIDEIHHFILLNRVYIIKIDSNSLNPEFFPERFELNDDFHL